MTRTREGGAAQPASECSEDIFEQAGLRLGRFAGQARQRFQQAAQAFCAQTDEDQRASQQKNRMRVGESNEDRPSATERSEELIDLLGQRVNHWVMVNGLQARRAVALLQENAEDMWVEAQSQYATWKSRREQVEEERH